MEYQSIISLILGIASVLITLRYLTMTDKLLEEMKFIRTKCIKVGKYNNINELILKLQDKHKLSLNQIKSIIINKNNEKYINYNVNSDVNNDIRLLLNLIN